MKEAVRNVQDYATFPRLVIQNWFIGLSIFHFVNQAVAYYKAFFFFFTIEMFQHKKLKRILSCMCISQILH